MKRGRFGRALGLLLVFGLVSSATGCGSNAPDPAGGITKEGIRKDYQQKKAAAAERTAVKRSSGRAR
jgi:hypothetical protein